MTDYLPTFNPGEAITFTANGTITGGQVLTVNLDGTVSASGPTASSKVVGVAGCDANAGDKIVVYVDGVHTLTATGTIAAGATVESANAGTVANHANGTNDVNRIGIALTGAAGGGTVRVQWQR